MQHQFEGVALSPWRAIRACQSAAIGRDWHTAVYWADQALACNPLAPDVNGLLHLLAGTARMYTGDFYRAERELTRFLTLSQVTPKLERLRGDALYTLGYLMRVRMRPCDEIRFFREAAQAYQAAGRTHNALHGRFETAWSLLMDHRPQEALPELALVAESISHSHSDLAQDMALAMAIYHHQCGQLDQAEEIALPLISQVGLPSRHMADAAWLLGCNALARGQSGRAEQYAAEALERAMDDWWPPQLERIQRLKEAVARTLAV